MRLSSSITYKSNRRSKNSNTIESNYNYPFLESKARVLLLISTMAPFDDTTAATRFDSFTIYRTSYKKIGDHSIEAGVLVPKDLKPGKHPLLVKFHGGGLVQCTLHSLSQHPNKPR